MLALLDRDQLIQLTAFEDMLRSVKGTSYHVQELRHLKRALVTGSKTSNADRKKLFKELQLRSLEQMAGVFADGWHPDKNVGDETRASEMCIRSVHRCDLGHPTILSARKLSAMATLLRRVPNLCRDTAHFSKQADARLQRALDDLEVSQPKLDDSETHITDLLHGNVVKFRFALPRLDPDSFREVLAQVDQNKEIGHVQLRQARTRSLVYLEAGEAMNGVEPADFQEDFFSMIRSLQEVALAAAVSFLVVLALSYSSMDLRVATWISGILSWLLQFLAFAQSWSKQVGWMFQALNGAVGRMVSTLDEPVAHYGQKVAQPLEALEASIDKLDMEQALVVKRMKEFEGQVRDVIPDFDVPTVDDLREPIVDCHTRIGNFLEETKGALPDELKELLKRHSTGHLVLQRSGFECRLVHVPLVLVFILNLSMLILSQVMVASASQGAVETPLRPGQNDALVQGFQEQFPQIKFSLQEDAHAPVVTTLAPSTGWSRWAGVLMPLPCFLQILLSALELLLGLYLTRPSRLLAMVGSVTHDLEKGCNAWIEKHSRGISAEVFATFGQVQKRAERFFPTYRLRMGQLRSFLLTGAKAEKASGVFGKAGSMFLAGPASP
eukprot:s1530_g7.t2